jgi:hypothetical protein
MTMNWLKECQERKISDMKEKLFENTSGNQFKLVKEVKPSSGLKEEETLRKVQKALLQCAKEIDKSIKKIADGTTKQLMSTMVSDLNQYGGGDKKITQMCLWRI